MKTETVNIRILLFIILSSLLTGCFYDTIKVPGKEIAKYRDFEFKEVQLYDSSRISFFPNTWQYITADSAVVGRGFDNNTIKILFRDINSVTTPQGQLTKEEIINSDTVSILEVTTSHKTVKLKANPPAHLYKEMNFVSGLDSTGAYYLLKTGDIQTATLEMLNLTKTYITMSVIVVVAAVLATLISPSEGKLEDLGNIPWY